MFNVGDEVAVIEGSRYSVTTTGSRGKVVEVISPYNIRIDFTYLASRPTTQSRVFIIDALDLVLVTPVVVDPHQAVINKIKEMEARRVKGTVVKKIKITKPAPIYYSW